MVRVRRRGAHHALDDVLVELVPLARELAVAARVLRPTRPVQDLRRGWGRGGARGVLSTAASSVWRVCGFGCAAPSLRRTSGDLHERALTLTLTLTLTPTLTLTLTLTLMLTLTRCAGWAAGPSMTGGGGKGCAPPVTYTRGP